MFSPVTWIRYEYRAQQSQHIWRLIYCFTDTSLQARRGRTTVISTSHVSVARIADVIIVLHNGEIIEQGRPEELMMSAGAFRYLATLQVICFIFDERF